ncbi:carcinoembryonic antigen-related cell adhesion molecule 5-like [Anolis sagrei]|uniref:carcinoembryonic antigen-related cell adhesion molecule 5-like n=1 Tax=Anolis sagrei TaxID=38937 RepID=UPI003521357C
MRGRGALGGQGGAGAPLAVLVLSLCFLLTRAQTGTTTTISVKPSKPIEGGDVSLIPASIPATTSTCRWFRGGNDPASTIFILFFYPAPKLTLEANYTGRETMDSTCSLNITNLAGNYSGTYTFLAESSDGNKKGEVELLVSGGVYGVSIQGPHSVIEPNPVTLRCTSFGFNVSYYWLKGNKLVNANGHISLTNNSQVLTFNSTTKEDTGAYTCFGNNSFSANESLPFELRVYYGPDSVAIEPRQQLYLADTNLSLTCRADSDPPATYTWYFSNDSLPIGNDAQYVISGLSTSDSGTYLCNASNANTGLSNTSSVQVTVLEPVRNVNITSNPSKVVEGTVTTLTCNADGTEVSYFWLKGDQILASDDRISLSDDNRNLTFNATVQSDSGNYTCYANNSLSSSNNTYSLDVFYGPGDPIISPNTTFYVTGSSLNLTCTADSNPLAQYTWRFNNDTHSGGNWLIDNLNVSQAGNYTCEAFNEETGWNSSQFLEIKVLEPVSDVSITSTPSKTEENDVVSLNCSAAKGTEVSYFWLKGDQILESNNRISLSDDNRNLTFNRTLQSDSGNYTCYANNSLSSSSSTHFLNVLYGPDVPLILPNKTRYESGSLLNLSCSADSNPPANYTWHYGDGKVFQGSNLEPFNLTLDDTGFYNCTASNDQTGRSETRSQEIVVVEHLYPPVLTPASYQPLEKENVTLTCNTSSTKSITVSWRKDGKDTLPENALLSANDETLTIQSFTQKDNGSYTCVASNGLDNQISNPSVLSMAYGPYYAMIVQSGDFTLRSNVSLVCSADSNPAPQFRWFFNNSETKETKPTYNIISATLEDTGVYRCQAFNPKTNITISVNVTMQIKKPDDTGGDTGLSGGAIAGIVIGCLAAVILIAGLLYYICTRTSVGRTERHASNGNVPSAPGHNQGATDSKPRTGDEDIQYSTLAFKASHPPQPAPAAGQASDGVTIYSEIRKK